MFGSRLATSSATSDSSNQLRYPNNLQLQPVQPVQPLQSVQSFQPSRVDAGLQLVDSFSNRQGQQMPAQDSNRARATRQQQRQNQAGLIGLPSEQTNRFQRIRVASGGNNEQQQQQQQQQPSGLLPMPPLPPPQFPVNPMPQIMQQQGNNRQQTPTLSAFDLSSLTNLANQAGNGFSQVQSASQSQQQQQQPQQPAFTRRIPAMNQNNQQQQQQQQQNFQRINGPNQNQNQIQNQNQNSLSQSQTELPFIRQVFRPVVEPEQQQSQAQSSGGRPTPPPIFVPGASQPQRIQQQQQRPVSVANQNGFAPMTRANINLQEQARLQQQQQQLTNNAGQNNLRASEQVFFEPSSQAQLTRSQSSSLATSLNAPNSNSINNNNNFARIQPITNNQQQGRLIPLNNQQPNLQMTTTRPQSQQFQQQLQQQQQQQQQQAAQASRRAPPRRPSQRPQLPQFSPSNDVVRLAAQQQPQSSSTSVASDISSTGPTTPTSVSSSSTGFPSEPIVNSTPDSQLTSTAGSSASSVFSSTSHDIGHLSSSPFASSTHQPNQFGSILNEWTSTTSSSTTESPAQTTPTTTTTTGQPAINSEQGRRYSVAPPLVRSSANIFALTSLQPTSAPSSFSPALPINQAAGASASGRRRIPIRPMSGGRGQQPVQATTTPLSSPLSSSTTTTTSTTQLPPLATTTQSSSVRKPEIEEFYETIAQQGNNQFGSPSGIGNLGSALTTQIDAFGSASRPKKQQQQAAAASSTTAATTTQANSSERDSPAGPDLYGSRLPAVSANEQFASPADSIPTNNNNNVENVQQANVNGNLQREPQQQQAASPVLVPVTYMTILTYLTTVLHGTHTLETSHESTVKSTQLATLNAQLMDQIEHRKPLIEPTMTLAVSSKTKGKGTTLVNLKSLVSAYNEELVEALGQQQQATSTLINPLTTVQPTATFASEVEPTAVAKLAANEPAVLGLADLQNARKSLVTELTYHYTIKPLQAANNNQASIDTTSVRSELVNAKSLEADELAQIIGSKQQAQLIDANGLLQLENPTKQQQVINLGKYLFISVPTKIIICLFVRGC